MMKTGIGKWGLVVAVVDLSLGTAIAAKMDSALMSVEGRSSQTVRAIVRFKSAATSSDTARLAKLGVRFNRSLGDGSWAAVSLSAKALRALANDPRVSNVSYDAEIKPNIDTTEHSILDSSIVWNRDFKTTVGLDGSGVGVAVIDSGVAYTNGLAGRMLPWYDPKSNRNYNANSSTDEYGHGTHVAGIIAGNNFYGSGMNLNGIARGSTLVPVKVLGSDGSGVASDVIKGIDWCVANRWQYNIDVINLSLSHPPYESYTTDPLCQAVERAWRAGIVVVCSAGNDGRVSTNKGYGTIGSPGNDPYVITVGAMNANKTNYRSDDKVATYSSKGPSLGDHILKPDLLAPGNKVISWNSAHSTIDTTKNTVHYGNTQYNGSTSFVELSGTSMSTPVVSAVAALMVQQNPYATPDQIKARLMLTADKTSDDVFTRGAGYINITAALASSSNSWKSAASATVIQKSDGTYALRDTITGQMVLWGDMVLWGNMVLWGDTAPYALCSNMVLWGDKQTTKNVANVYSSSFVTPDMVLWGDNGVGGDALTKNPTRMALWGNCILADGD